MNRTTSKKKRLYEHAVMRQTTSSAIGANRELLLGQPCMGVPCTPGTSYDESLDSAEKIHDVVRLRAGRCMDVLVHGHGPSGHTAYLPPRRARGERRAVR